MRTGWLAAIGSTSFDKIGIAPHSAELRQMAGDRMELREVGRRRLSLVQCDSCLTARPKSVATCPRCGRSA